MIATTIGRTFLDAYNEKYGKSLTAKEFFDQVYFEYFFNHPKYFFWAQNSPFVQGVTTLKTGKLGFVEVLKDPSNSTIQFDTDDELETYAKKIEIDPYFSEFKSKNKKQIKVAWELNEDISIRMKNDFHEKVIEAKENQNVEASIAIGFPASELKEFATTSGAVTDITIDVDEEEVYLSWIGSGLGVGVAGGYSIFFDEKDILLQLFEGWNVYRNFLNDPSLDMLRGNQIITWNGRWLNYYFGKKFREDFDFAQLLTNNVFSANEKTIEVQTVKWSELVFNISRRFPDQTFTGYVYSLGQTNKTLGFYPFQFSKARTLVKYYEMLFGKNAAIKDASQYESIYGIHIKRACELGSIGLQAMEPANLRKYFGNDSNLKLSKPKISERKGESGEEFLARKEKLLKKDEENIVTYRTYKTWLLAMITKNKEETLEYTLEVAEALLEYRLSDKNGSTKRANLVKTELLGAKSKKGFLDALSVILHDIDESKLENIKELRNNVHLMNTEDFGYFIVLLKFDYAFAERNS